MKKILMNSPGRVNSVKKNLILRKDVDFMKMFIVQKEEEKKRRILIRVRHYMMKYIHQMMKMKKMNIHRQMMKKMILYVLNVVVQVTTLPNVMLKNIREDIKYEK